MDLLKKSYLLRIVFLITLSSGATESIARHIVGGEIFYECLDPGSSANTRNYKLTMKIYRDCFGNGAEFDNPAQFGIYTYINGVYAFAGFRNVNHGSVTNIVGVENPCLILPDNVCVEEASYIFTLNNMPLIDGSYIVSWQRCCRNNTINNIIAPNNTGATFTIEITEEAQQVCNDGPKFNEFPPIGICVNDSINFDHSAMDNEGDQIIYEFCAPLQGGGPLGVNDPNQQTLCDGITPDPSICLPPYNDVAFAAPNYSAINPLGTVSPISINPATGFIRGIPRQVGQYVIGVCVKEYRNGVLLSVLRRDFQFNVVNCQAAVSAEIKSDAVINGNEFVINSCGENTVTFINESGIEAFISTYRWTFDINGTDYEVFTRNATVTFPGVGNYKGRLIINQGLQCGDTAFINLNVYPSINADFDFDFDTCTAGPVNFTDMSNTMAQNLTDWEWSFGDSEESGDRHPDHLYLAPGMHEVMLVATDNNSCKDTIQKEVQYFPVPPLIIIKPEQFLACVPEDITFTNLSVPIDETYDIRWDFGDGGTSDQISPSHNYTQDGIYTVRVEITSPIGCYIEETFPNLITMKASPRADFTFTPEIINSINSTAQFTDLSTGSTGWFWQFGDEGHSFLQEPVYTFKDTGVTDIMQVVFHPNGCADTLIKRVDIEPVVQFFLPNAFTPNFDGKNEVYKPEGLSEGLTSYSLSIWSRWGEKLFETSNPADGWNGRKLNSGQELPMGVYLCVLEYTDARDRIHELREFVTLIR